MNRKNYDMKREIKENSMDYSRFETKENGIISGYASVFNVADAYNDVVKKAPSPTMLYNLMRGKNQSCCGSMMCTILLESLKKCGKMITDCS